MKPFQNNISVTIQSITLEFKAKDT